MKHLVAFGSTGMPKCKSSLYLIHITTSTEQVMLMRTVFICSFVCNYFGSWLLRRNVWLPYLIAWLYIIVLPNCMFIHYCIMLKWYCKALKSLLRLYRNHFFFMRDPGIIQLGRKNYPNICSWTHMSRTRSI